MVHAAAPGFADPVHDAQATFRAVMAAMSYPGRVIDLRTRLAAPPPLASGAAALCLTLADLETRVWLAPGLATPEVRAFLRFHTGAALTEDPGTAQFAILTGNVGVTGFEAFSAGSERDPEHSATLIFQVSSLRSGRARPVSGPGIKTRATIAVEGLAPAFWQALRLNHAMFPRGVDLILVAGTEILALPRTTFLEG